MTEGFVHPDIVGHTADAVRDHCLVVLNKVVSFDDSENIASRIVATQQKWNEAYRDSLPADAVRILQPGFQGEVGDWMLVCFGEETAADQLERADRFTEEALELAQTMPGFTAERAHALVDYVFGRPVGERGQEVGGTMVTLAALCNTVGLSIPAEAERELARVWTKVEAIRAKQASKPKGSALPTAAEAA